MLEVQGLCRLMLQGVSVRVGAGEVLCLRGDSGAGKTVLLRAIADLDPNTGEVACNGVARASVSGPEWRRRVAYVAAEPAWWMPLVAQHFEPAADWREDAARLGLAGRVLDGPVAQASTGERQRLALLRALARRPEALLLDEPTSALDTTSKHAVETMLRELGARGIPVVLVTHDDEQVARLRARTLRLRAGCLEEVP